MGSDSTGRARWGRPRGRRRPVAPQSRRRGRSATSSSSSKATTSWRPRPAGRGEERPLPQRRSKHAAAPINRTAGVSQRTESKTDDEVNCACTRSDQNKTARWGPKRRAGVDTDDDDDSDPDTTDCDDNNAAINNSATEVCDAVDNDCDTFIDEDLDVDGILGVDVDNHRLWWEMIKLITFN